MGNTILHQEIGGDILGLITTGMYDTPLAVYREYIQNAADSVRSSSNLTNGRVNIRISPAQRRITIRDNGQGLSPSTARTELVAIARSRKLRGVDRGFRGIGRLSGLAFAEQVAFKTRCSADDPVTQVTWNGHRLRSSVSRFTSLNQAVDECVEISELEGTDYPEHFFDVEIGNVSRHAAGTILNTDAVGRYISEVCPVPFSGEFPFRDELEKLFDDHVAPLCLDVHLNSSDKPIVRPFGNGLSFSEEVQHPFIDLESFHIPSTEGNEPAAIGWLAHTEYFGAIPKNLGVRGIRAREGNLQIGGENTFDHLFPEQRFNRWCVGEVHVIDARITPNGRRDYFEPGPHTRNLENQLEAVARRVANRCRNESIGRNKLRRFRSELRHGESALELAATGFLKAADSRQMVQSVLARLSELSDTTCQFDNWPSKEKAMAESLERRLRAFRPKRGRPALGRIQKSDIGSYQRVFRSLVEASPTPDIALKTIRAVIGSTQSEALPTD